MMLNGNLGTSFVVGCFTLTRIIVLLCSEVAMCLFGEVGDTRAALCSYNGLKSLFCFY